MEVAQQRFGEATVIKQAGAGSSAGRVMSMCGRHAKDQTKTGGVAAIERVTEDDALRPIPSLCDGTAL